MDEFFDAAPALDRLRWLLAGLNGHWATDEDVGPALAPDYAAAVPAEVFRSVMQDRAGRWAPLQPTGVEVEGCVATARFRSRDGDLLVARVAVEPSSPYRLVEAYAQPVVPTFLGPRLPGLFRPGDLPSATGTVLMVFAGVPGSGKSTVAEAVGAALDRPVYALDWLLGALSPFGLYHRTDLLDLGGELLVTLAVRELTAGRSVIVDAPHEDQPSRDRWHSLAEATGARLVIVECVCSDPQVHRSRVEQRRRGIPGWADAGNWADVGSRSAAFEPWAGALVVDTIAAVATCVDLVLDHLSRG